MGNDDNKTQLLKLLLDQWKTTKYAPALHGRFFHFVLGEICYRLTSPDGKTVEVFQVDSLSSTQEEADTRIILHCIHVRDTEPDNTTILVRSPDTDVLVLLMHFSSQINRSVLFDNGVGNKRRLLSVPDLAQHMGTQICSILPAYHALTGCDTTSAFVRKGKIAPLKVVEKNPNFVSVLSRLGQEHVCSEELLEEVEEFVCAIYGKPKYKDINKLRYDCFCKKNQGHGNILNSYNTIDMSLLPPCRGSLEMHSRRVSYQTYIWLHAVDNRPDLPDIRESGWKEGENGIEFEWTSGAIVPEELIDILCASETDNRSDDDDEDEDDVVELNNLTDEIFDDDGDCE